MMAFVRLSTSLSLNFSSNLNFITSSLLSNDMNAQCNRCGYVVTDNRCGDAFDDKRSREIEAALHDPMIDHPWHQSARSVLVGVAFAHQTYSWRVRVIRQTIFPEY